MNLPKTTDFCSGHQITVCHVNNFESISSVLGSMRNRQDCTPVLSSFASHTIPCSFLLFLVPSLYTWDSLFPSQSIIFSNDCVWISPKNIFNHPQKITVLEWINGEQRTNLQMQEFLSKYFKLSLASLKKGKINLFAKICPKCQAVNVCGQQ